MLAWINRASDEPARHRLPGGTGSGVHLPGGLGLPFFSASVCGRPFLCRPATAFVGPDRWNRLCFACDFAPRAHDRPIVRPPLLRFGSLQRLQAVLRYPRRPAFGPSRFDFAPANPDSAGGRIICSRRRPCGFSALCPPCARPTPRDLCHGSHRSGLGHSPRSLFRAAFRYPVDRTLSRPGRVDFYSTRQRSWDSSCPSQFSLAAGPRISAVHPHLPLSDSFARESADFYGLPVAHFSAPSRRDDSKATDGADDPTGFWVMLPRAS